MKSQQVFSADLQNDVGQEAFCGQIQEKSECTEMLEMSWMWCGKKKKKKRSYIVRTDL
jgi:hypothetical protein